MNMLKQCELFDIIQDNRSSLRYMTDLNIKLKRVIMSGLQICSKIDLNISMASVIRQVTEIVDCE
jgi:hypothetical protein